MGSRISALCREYDGLAACRCIRNGPGHKETGKDIGIIAGIGETGVILQDSIEKIIDTVDLIIDFTSIESTKEI